MKSFLFGLVAAVVVIGLALPAQAGLIQNVVQELDFSTSPIADHGFVAATGANTVDPDTMLNSAAGTWNVNLAGNPSGKLSSYKKVALAAELAGTTDNYFGGEATLTVSTGSTAQDDLTIIGMITGNSTTGVSLTVSSVPGAMKGYCGSDGAFGEWSVNVANTDGLAHTYGWAVDAATHKMSVYFDNALMLANINVNGNWDGTGENLYLGDGTGGAAHAEVWDNWVVGTNIVPEPSAVIILVTGLFGLVCYAWRKRK